MLKLRVGETNNSDKIGPLPNNSDQEDLYIVRFGDSYKPLIDTNTRKWNNPSYDCLMTLFRSETTQVMIVSSNFSPTLLLRGPLY